MSNECGLDSDTVLVKKEKCFCSVYIPNSFTPNYDKINDKLIVSTNCELSRFDFKIMNRWGELIFESNAPDNQWDGTIDGKLAQQGVYNYVITYQFKDEQVAYKTGHISVLK